MVEFWIAATLMTTGTAVLLIRSLHSRNDNVDESGKDSSSKNEASKERHQPEKSNCDDLSGTCDPSSIGKAADHEPAHRRLVSQPDNQSYHPSAQLDCRPAKISRRTTSWRTKLNLAHSAGAGRSPVLGYFISGAVSLGALAIYLSLGYPNFPIHSQQEQIEFARAVAGLEQQLRLQPANLEGWILLAHAYGQLGAAAKSVLAWRQAGKLDAHYPIVLGGLGEALVIQNGGVVIPEAHSLFVTLNETIPSDPQAGYYLGLFRAQSGDLEGALNDWQELLTTAPSDSSWVPAVRYQVQQTARALGLDPGIALP